MKAVIKRLFSRKKYRWLQKLTRIHRVHHPRWSMGWAPKLWSSKNSWVYFEAYGWKRLSRDSYHNSTISGVY